MGEDGKAMHRGLIQEEWKDPCYLLRDKQAGRRLGLVTGPCMVS